MKFDQDLCLNLQYDFGKMNSTLGSVVPLAMFLVLSTLYVEAGTVLKHVAAYFQLGTAAVLKIFSLGTFAVLKIFSLGTFAVWRCPAGPSRGGMPGSAMPCYAIMPPLSRMS